MIVLGIDPGATTGLATINYSRPDAPRFVDGYAVRDNLEAIWRLPQPDLIALESVGPVYSRERFGAGMASALVVAARIEGRILEMARAASIPVLQCTAAEWRKVIAGSRRRGERRTEDARIKEALSLRMKLPRCSAHVRDAIGAALYGAQKWRVESMRRNREEVA